MSVRERWGCRHGRGTNIALIPLWRATNVALITLCRSDRQIAILLAEKVKNRDLEIAPTRGTLGIWIQ